MAFRVYLETEGGRETHLVLDRNEGEGKLPVRRAEWLPSGEGLLV